MVDHEDFDDERPTLYCPFTAHVHPLAEATNASTQRWLKETGLAGGEGAGRHLSANYGALAGRAYPWASAEGLAIAADWTAWLFVRDDVCDASGFGADPDAGTELNHRLLATLLAGEDLTGSSLSRALLDLRGRMLRLGGELWLARFCASVRDYFEACTWEAENRRSSVLPGLIDYKCMRRHAGAVQTCVELIEITDDIHLPLHVRHAPAVVRLGEIANDAICWSNDIFSAEKELAEGDVHNLVIILMRIMPCSLEEAVGCVARMHNEILREFVTLEEGARGVSPELDHYVDVLKAWVRANLDWSLATTRYSTGLARVSQDDTERKSFAT
jgi:5-epi-alpha-selinene synthase